MRQLFKKKHIFYRDEQRKGLNLNRIGRFFSLGILLLFAVGCATIPKASVQLSEELTQMIYDARAAHLAMVDQFMVERRQRADDFLRDIWRPDYMNTLIEKSEVLKHLEKASTNSEKQKILLDFLEASLKVISERRASLMDALNDIEITLKQKIEDHYANMIIINQALTAHLRSAAEVTETREELLKQLKINPIELLPLGKITSSIDKLISLKGRVEEVSGIVTETKNLIKEGK